MRTLKAAWRRSVGAIVMASMALATAGTAIAQPYDWTVVNLHPAGATGSTGRGARGDQQVGRVSFGGDHRAAIWTSTPEGWVDLDPAAGGTSLAAACTPTHQVGFVLYTPGGFHAAYWNGTAQSYVDLHPAGASNSTAYDLLEGVQSGGAQFNGEYHAGLWKGTAASWTDLHPKGASDSYIEAMDEAQQGGFAQFGGEPQAALWTGTAESFVNLTPAGASGGYVWDVRDGWQCGYAVVGGQKHAGMWNGTAASWFDRHWPGASESIAYGINGDLMVGQATIDGVGHAVAWDLKYGQLIDLSQWLPGSWGKTVAQNLSRKDGLVYIIGTGFNNDTQRSEALLWIGEESLGCYNDCNQDGTLSVDDFICFMTYYNLGDQFADCDGNGTLNLDDWICWQIFFVIGC